MSETNLDLIYNTLLKQNEQLGRIEANQTTDKASIASHETRLGTLEVAHNKQLGAVRTWSVIVSAVVSGVIGYFSGKH